MAQTRREFLRCAAGLGGLLLAGSAKPAAARHSASVRAALGFFAGRQSADGAWRAASYAAFRDGDAGHAHRITGVSAPPSRKAA